jgi:uncharacterized membrane-anchored protein
MSSVDPGTVQWLREGALYATATSAPAAAAWGADAIETEIMSPLASATDAAAEAASQLAFLGGPLAIDTHDVPGLRADLIARPVTIVSDHLGYEAGLTVFVVGVQEKADVERTILTVLRRLP